MVNLVKTIESTNKSDQKQMKFLKKQLRSNLPDINKLRQSTVSFDMMIAPIHAAVMTENIEILQQILAMKEVHVDATGTVRTSKILKFGVIDAAFYNGPPFNLDIIKLLLKHVQMPHIGMIMDHSIGVPLPFCLIEAVKGDYLDIVVILLKNADLLGRQLTKHCIVKIDGISKKIFDPYYCLAIAIEANRPRVFNHLLQLTQWDCPLDSLIEYARVNNRTDMCEELEKIRKINEARKGKDIKLHDSNEDEMTIGGSNDRETVGDGCEALDCSHKEKMSETRSYYLEKEEIFIENNNSEEAKGSDKKNEDLEEEKKAVRKSKYCWNCENFGLHTCTGCRKAKYCGEKCQWEDWDSHKEYCLVKMNKIAFKEFESLSVSIFE